MVDRCILNRIMRRCGYDQGVCISSRGRSGGMGFWWLDTMVTTISYSAHHYAADVVDSQGRPKWRAIGIYGWPETENKAKTWELMEQLLSECSGPCVCFGDFNEITSMREKEGGVSRRESLMDAFRGAIDTCGLKDLGYKGCMFTWQRGTSPETMIRERLDRFLADDSWCNMWPNYSVRHFPIECSNHAAILLDARTHFDRGKKERLFRFEAMWLSREDCGNVVAKAWKESGGVAVHERIGNCAKELSMWAGETFGNIKKKIRKAENKLAEAQRGRVDSHMMARCNALSGELGELRRLEESYWFARSRANEMRDGDKNTSYFHRKASQRKKRNYISGLFDKHDVWREGVEI